MKSVVILLISVLLSGCFFIIKEEEKANVFGSPKETAYDLLDKIEKIKPEEKKEIEFFNEYK